jgi:hypothetical protein
MSESDKITIVGIAINATLFIASMVWAWFLNKRTIQATLQADQPAPKAKAKPKKALTRRQRHAIKILRLIQAFVVVGIIADINNDVPILYYSPTAKLKIAYFVVAAIAYTSMITVFVQAYSLIKRAKANDKSVLAMFGDPPKKGRSNS